MRRARSMLPPYGWWVRERAQKTVVQGWDWMIAATTLTHGGVTLPLACWWMGSYVLGAALWILASLMIAAGVGWLIVIDERGFVFSHTWFGLPLTRRRFDRGAPVGLEDDPYAPDQADFGRYVWVGSEEGCECGARANADAVKAALEQAIQRHHRAT